MVNVLLGTLLGALHDQILNVRGSVFRGEAPEGVKDRAVSGAAADVTVEDLLDLSGRRRRVVSPEARNRNSRLEQSPTNKACHAYHRHGITQPIYKYKSMFRTCAWT